MLSAVACGMWVWKAARSAGRARCSLAWMKKVVAPGQQRREVVADALVEAVARGGLKAGGQLDSGLRHGVAVQVRCRWLRAGGCSARSGQSVQGVRHVLRLVPRA